MENNIVIHTEELTKTFGNFTAVDHISFDVRRGEIFGFLGANGAGKTTAMRMLCGLSTPTSGVGRVAGFDIARQSEAVKKNIGYMSQKFSLYEDLKVWENLRLFGGIYGMKTKTIASETDRILHELGFEKERNTLVKSLPLGWKQKLSFSVSIFHEPKVVFLDEPTAALDPIAESEIYSDFHRIVQDKTALFISHRLSACRFSKDIIVFCDGRIVQQGNHEMLISKDGLYRQMWNAQAQYYK